MTNSSVPSAPPPQALFLDLDGTLMEFRDDPVAVHADSELRNAVSKCSERLGGALALISGRSIADLDVSFSPQCFPAAGLHGLERRDSNGKKHSSHFTPDTLVHARASVRAAISDDRRRSAWRVNAPM